MTVSAATGNPGDSSVDAIRRTADEGLVATRSRLLPASPDGGGMEPEMFHARHGMFRDGTTPAPPGPPPSEPTVTVREPASSCPSMPGTPKRPTVLGLLADFRAGTDSPSRVLDRYRSRWSTSPSGRDALISVVPGAADAAAESDRRWRTGAPRALEGIPFGVKDIIDVAGASVTCGSLQTGDRVAARDAEAVARLRAAGAIPVAMVATTEFAMGAAANARYGVVANPWNRDCWTGGSSTGSAAGLAAGLFPLALGTDTGGSVRIPSSFCGTTGFKPTYERVPRAGVACLSWSLDHVGPMGLTAADLRYVLPILDGRDHESMSGASPSTAIPDRRPLAGLTVAVLDGFHSAPVARDVQTAFRAALGVLEDLGAEVRPWVAPDYDAELTHVEAWNVFYGEVASTQEGHQGRMHLYDSGTRERIHQGQQLDAIDYLRGLRRRGSALDAVVGGMDQSGVDLLVCPTTLATAPFHGDMTMRVNGDSLNIHDLLPRNSRLFDYTGMPALALPMGLSSEAMPVSLQVIGRPWADDLVLFAGESFQSITGFHHLMPGDQG